MIPSLYKKTKGKRFKNSAKSMAKIRDMFLTPRLGFFPPHLCVSQSVGHRWQHPRDRVRTAAVQLRGKKSNAQKQTWVGIKEPSGNAESQVLLQTSWIGICIFTQSPGDSYAHFRLNGWRSFHHTTYSKLRAFISSYSITRDIKKKSSAWNLKILCR